MADKNKKIAKKFAGRFASLKDKQKAETIQKFIKRKGGTKGVIGDHISGMGAYSKGGKVPKGYHRMPNGKLMKDSAMKKKMGGGMMQQPMGYDKGGMCRGMGAAIRGGKFEGVK